MAYRILQAVCVVIAFATSPVGDAEEIGLLHLGALHLQFPPTWKFDFSKRPISGLGPNGEVALITVEATRDVSSAQGQHAVIDAVKGFGRGPMVSLGTKSGLKIERSVAEVATPPGHIAFSEVSDRSGLFGPKQYFVQYIFGGTTSLIYMTFEGKGDSAAAASVFDQIISTQTWTDGV